MIFAFVSRCAGTVVGLPNRNSKRLFSRTSNEISKKAVRFSLEVWWHRKAPWHQLFSDFFAKAIKMPGQFVYGGGFQVLLSSHKIPQGIGKRWHSKSVCAKAHKGSNPFLSAKQNRRRQGVCSAFPMAGFERVGSEWPAGGRSEPTLTEPAGESESLPLRHKKSTAVLIELRWIFSMTENRLK